MIGGSWEQRGVWSQCTRDLVSAFHHRVAHYTLCLDDTWIWKRGEEA